MKRSLVFHRRLNGHDETQTGGHGAQRAAAALPRAFSAPATLRIPSGRTVHPSRPAAAAVAPVRPTGGDIEMPIEMDHEITQDFARAAEIEWLETNGLGGWAGTTVAGAHSRRYHGLLVAATEPAERTVLLSRLDETLHVEGASFDLGCNQFPGIVSPRGFEYLTAFRKDLLPVSDYEAGGV